MEITEGQPQPIDCPNCKCKKGFRITQVQQIHSDVVFDEFGTYKTIIDSDYRKTIRALKKVSCHECLSVLPFKLTHLK